MIFQRDEVALSFLDEGRGVPVVLLHGHTLDLRVWDDLAPVLVKEGFRAIRYDQRGHGRSSSPPHGYRLADHADDLAALVGHLDAAPAHVVALSKGAAIALEAAVRRPQLLRSLVLVGPLVPEFPLSRETTASFKDLARLIRSAGVEAAMRNLWLTHPLIAPAHAVPRVRGRLEAMLLAFPAGEYLATGRDAPEADWKVIDHLDEIRVPTLIVSGEHEIADFVAMATLLADRVAGSALEVVPDCGHLVPLERPKELAASVIPFLAPI